MQSQYKVELRDHESGNMKDVLLNGGHIGQVGEQRNSKGKPYAQPRYWWSMTIPDPDAPGETKDVAEGDYLEQKWAVEGLIRAQKGMDKFVLEDVTDRFTTSTMLLLGDLAKVTMVLGHDGHVSSIVAPKGEFVVGWFLEPKRLPVKTPAQEA